MMSEGPVVLLVEDNEMDAEYMQEALGMRGEARIALNWVRSIEEALEFLEGGPTDLILLDLWLSDGFALTGLEKIRRQAPDIPVVVLTGMGNDEMASEAIKLGARGYIVKGQGHLDELLKVVQDVSGCGSEKP